MKLERAKRGQRIREYIEFLWGRRGQSCGITTNGVARQLGHAHGNAHKILSRLNYLMPEFVEKKDGYWVIRKSETILTLSGCFHVYNLRAKAARPYKKHVKKIKKNKVQKTVNMGLWGVHKVKATEINGKDIKSYESVLDKEKLIPINKDVPFPKSQYVIEKDIPMPRPDVSLKSKYPLDRMEVGDSFFVPIDLNRLVNVRNSVFAVAAKYNPNRKFKTRKDGNGIRVWRVV